MKLHFTVLIFKFEWVNIYYVIMSTYMQESTQQQHCGKELMVGCVAPANHKTPPPPTTPQKLLKSSQISLTF